MHKKNTSNLSSLLDSANRFSAQGNHLQAISCLEKAVAISNDASSLLELARLYKATGQGEKALFCFNLALKNDDMTGAFQLNCANIAFSLGSPEKAIEHLKCAVLRDKNLEIPAKAIEVSIKESTGLIDEAFSEAANLIDSGHRCQEILWAYSRIISQHNKFSEHTSKAIEAIKESIHNGEISKDFMPSFYFRLSELHQRNQNYEDAFNAAKAGHHLKTGHYDEPRQLSLFNHVEEAWQEKDTTKHEPVKNKRKFLFVVGMPRSGSTLVEQILASNDNSITLGESHIFSEVTCQVLPNPQDLGRIGARILSTEEIAKIKSRFTQAIFRKQKPKEFVIDKTLINKFHIGQILQSIPGAKIIWARRDPRDVCMSCYLNDFSGALPYRHDLKTLARYHNRTEELMKFWIKKHPESIYELHYEELIKNTEEYIKRLVDFCQMPWTDQFLSFHQNKRLVQTVSYNQVRKPIYSSSIHRWKNFSSQIGPLLESLEIDPYYQQR
ncbi:MAG: hypothetical protein C0621_08470 [Desulfuromonas sp.]|nr:MAG: hypothetical protein C0621_08470 [Desulfuromonas sp.]